MRERSLGPVIAAAVIVVALILYIFTFQVRYTEVAIRVRGGKPIATIAEPGLKFKLPWPIEEIVRFDKRIRTYDRQTVETQTADENPVVITPYFNWRISQAEGEGVGDDNGSVVFLRSFKTIREAESKLASMVGDEVGKLMGETRLADLLTTDPAHAGNFSRLEASLAERIKGKAEREYGVDVVAVGLKRLQLPESVTQAVFASMIAERRKEVVALAAEGDGLSAAIRGRADAIAREIMAAVAAEAKQIRSEGIAEAARYYSVFAQNQELHNLLRELEALPKMFAARTTILLDGSSPAVGILADPAAGGGAGTAKRGSNETPTSESFGSGSGQVSEARASDDSAASSIE
jgi:membrane protease subunit HflC